MKIAIYTIAKNEAQFVRRWATNAADADYRVVLDTGSQDGTQTLLREEGVAVYEAKIEPWRFDVARNRALQKVPADAEVCISLDLDEVLRPGWRQALEQAWTPGTTLLRHPLYPEWSADNTKPEGYWGYVGRVHARALYYWHYALHEVLRPTGTHVETFTDDFIIEHHTDKKRNKDLYTEMLAGLTSAEPSEARYAFYMAVDLFNRGYYRDAIAEFERYVSLSDKGAGGERAFARRSMARAHYALGSSPATRLSLLHEATADAPQEREVWVAFAEACAEAANWPNCFAASVNALRITDPRKSFHVEIDTWQGKAERLLHLSAQHLGISDVEVKKLLTQISS